MLINCVISSSRPIRYHRSFVLAPLLILISVVKLLNKVAQIYLVIIYNTTLLHPFIQCPSDQFRRVGGHPVVLVKLGLFRLILHQIEFFQLSDAVRSFRMAVGTYLRTASVREIS